MVDGPTPESVRSDIDAAFEETRAKVALALRNDPAGDVPTAGGWSLRELAGHVAFWEEAGVPVVTYMLRGQQIPPPWTFGSGYVTQGEWPHFEAHNAREAEWARSQPIQAVLDRWESAHQRLLATLETVTPEEAVANANYFRELADHLREHGAELP